jgi:hypothetical protein
MEDTFKLLQSVAPNYGATLIDAPEGGHAAITVVRPGDSKHSFELVVFINGEHVSVREAPGKGMLPRFCPDRHINRDSSFCLGWGDDDPSVIRDIEAAKRWWAAVYQFLLRQTGANNRRIFPGAEHSRAHGNAAKHQAKAEAAAARISAEFSRKAASRKFIVRKDAKPGKRRLELWLENKRIARVSTRSKDLVGGHTLCPCDATPPREIAACGSHAQDLATFILEQHHCNASDRKFLDDLAADGVVCCETLNDCGLRDAIKRIQKPNTNNEKPHARRSNYWRPPAKSKRPR